MKKNNNEMMKISVSMRDTETNKGFVKDVEVTFKKGRSVYKAIKCPSGSWFGSKISGKTSSIRGGHNDYFDSFVDLFKAC